MSQLLLDIGNTFAKYRVLSGGTVVSQGKVATAELQRLQYCIESLAVTDIWLANVGRVDAINDVQLQYPGACIHHVTSESVWRSVKNGYTIPNKLGVDRWLGVIEAYYHSACAACAVFDLGSALTLDVVDAKGQHLGGYILPGLVMMRDVLQLKTQQVRFESVQYDGLGYGCDTGSAVAQGTQSAVIAWVNAEMARFRSQFPQGCVYITGGVAGAIMPYITGQVIYDEDLILNALMRMATN